MSDKVTPTENKPKTAQDFSIVELKAIKSDERDKIDIAQRNISMINQEIQLRNTSKPPVEDKSNGR